MVPVYKPDKQSPLNCKLASFDYGVNSPRFDPSTIRELTKQSIDYGFFWDFVRQKLRVSKRTNVDEDLLLNLIHLKSDLERYVPREKTYVLIERCLFLKFLEDRHFLERETAVDILKNGNSEHLISKFGKINTALNGDIFDESVLEIPDIPVEAMSRLFDFFTTDYRNQIRLFPYNFSILPIELLSNIYEAFLKTEKRLGEGIYYTPAILVDIILNDTLETMLQKNRYLRCIDFSCGSGVFLVKAYERFIDRYQCHSDFEAKKKLLKNCIFGIEKDKVAARITIFSLYLKLLEGEDPHVLRESIRKNRIKFPRLFNKNIQCKNALFDKINFTNEDGKTFRRFDVVVGNPPWGVNPFADPGIDDRSQMNLPKDKQEAVTPYQSSQYFILKAQDFMSERGMSGILTNTSNLLTSKSRRFRLRLLQDYNCQKIYDFTRCNPILFKKRKLKLFSIDSRKSREIDLGADEPAAALILNKARTTDQPNLQYIRPSLDLLTRLLKVIAIRPSNVKTVPKLLLQDDLAWRVLATGDLDDYRLIQKLKQQKSDTRLTGFYGIRFKRSGKPTLANFEYFDKDCLDHFLLREPKRVGKTPKSIRRPGKSFPGQLLIHRYVKKDLRVKAAHDPKGLRYQDNLIGLLSTRNDPRLLLALYNSSLISYFLFHNSAQIGKGTYNMLHKNEVESIPVPSADDMPSEIGAEITKAVAAAQSSGAISDAVLRQIDELVFDMFHLKDFEKQKIRDFFSTVERTNARKEIVEPGDFEGYVKRFRSVISFVLRDDKFLNATAFCSRTIGAGITFTIVDVSAAADEVIVTPETNLAKIIRHIAKRDLEQSKKISLIKQEKLKLYDRDFFTIIKSNHYSDWTQSVAIEDANEEIELFLKQLPEG